MSKNPPPKGLADLRHSARDTSVKTLMSAAALMRPMFPSCASRHWLLCR